MAAYQYVYVMRVSARPIRAAARCEGVFLSFPPGAKTAAYRPERLRQVDAAADHGRHNKELRRGVVGRSATNRLCSPGTRARSAKTVPRTSWRVSRRSNRLLDRLEAVERALRRGARRGLR